MAADASKHLDICLLASVDRRLEDVHQQWHQADAAYFDPEKFRIAIQTSIQTLRTVTFILQSNKNLIPDFQSWYQEWQDRLRADALMRWMVDARNRIEKQGDLEAHSVIRAEIVASYLDEGPSIEFAAELFDGPQQLIEKIPANQLGEHIRKHGALRIQRRWVENTLPIHELLDAVAIAYGKLAELVRDAHRAAGLPPPVTIDAHSGRQYDEGARGGRMPCMIGHQDLRSLYVGLADGKPIAFESREVEIDLRDRKKLLSRYGIDFPNWETSSEAELGNSLFETARRLFLTDGYHITIIMMFKQGRPVSMIKVDPQNQAEKYLLMRQAAREVTIHNADTVTMIGEIWSAPPDPAKPYMRAAESPDRREALLATIVTKDAEPLTLRADIFREDGRVSLGDTSVSHGGAQFMFAPIYEAWGKAIPEEWYALVKKMHEPVSKHGSE